MTGGRHRRAPRRILAKAAVPCLATGAVVLAVWLSIGGTAHASTLSRLTSHRAGPAGPAARNAANHTAPAEHNVFHVTRDDGLATDQTTALAMTTDGAMWIGTEAGLSRYDGNDVTTIGNDVDSGVGLAGSTVTALAGGKDVWVGMTTGGLDRIDINTMAVRHYPPGPQLGRGFPDPSGAISSLALDGERLWIGSSRSGVVAFDIQTGVFESVPGTSGRIAALAVDYKRDAVWAATPHGLLQIDRTTRRVIRTVTAADGHGLPSSDITGVDVSSTGGVWAGTAEAGVAHLAYDETNWTVFHGPPGGTAAYRVRALRSAADDTVWVASGAEVFHLDPRSGSATKYVHDPSNPLSLAPGSVNDLFIDTAGLVWVSNNGTGVDYFNPNTSAARRLQLPTGQTYDPQRNDVTAVVPFGRLSAGDALITNGATAAFLPFGDGPAHRTATSVECPVLVSVTANRFAWCIGTGITRYDYTNNDWATVAPALPAVLGTSRPVAVGDRTGGAWLVTDAGVAHLDANGRVLAQASMRQLGLEIAPGTFTAGVLSGVHLFLAGPSTGLTRLDTTTMKLAFVSSAGAILKSPGPGSVRDLAADDRGHIYAVGTMGLIVYVFDAMAVQRYGKADGLRTSNLRGVAVDPASIWLSSDVGIDRIDRRTNHISHYGTFDGLQPSGFNPRSIAIAADGAIVAGGLQGMSVIDPAVALRSSCDRPPALRSVTSGDRTIAFQNSRVRIRPDVSLLRFRFSQSCYSRVADAKLRYRVDGSPWTALPLGDFDITMSRPTSGTHRIEVQATNRQNTWVATLARVELEVTPEGWRQPWTRAVIVVLLLGVAAAGLWERERRTRLRTSQMEDQVAQQTAHLNAAYDRAAASLQAEQALIDVITHDVRAPLLRQMAYLGLKDAHPAVIDLEVIRREAVRMDEMLRRLLTAREGDVSTDHIETVGVAVRDVLDAAVGRASAAAADKGISIRVAVADHNLLVLADRDVCDEVFDNLLSNAIKYSYPNSTVHVLAEAIPPQTATAGAKVEVRVRDHGVGVASDDGARLFSRFGRGRRRPTAGEGSTGLGLYAVRQSLQRIDADIRLESAGPDQGTTAICTFMAVPATSSVGNVRSAD